MSDQQQQAEHVDRPAEPHPPPPPVPDPFQPTSDEVLDALQIVFHQTATSYDGAAPALNAVLQGPYFEDESLTQLTGGGPIDAYAVNMALRSFNLSLEPILSLRRQSEPHTQNAFVCFQHQRWFALRRLGKHWLNLNDLIGRPAQILPHQLAVSLSQLEDDGCEIYAVLGTLPPCAADDTSFFDTHFLWFLSGGIVPADPDPEDCECDVLYEESFEDDLQKAIAASLVEPQPTFQSKPLVIKTTSPPTSLISSENQRTDPADNLSLDTHR